MPLVPASHLWGYLLCIVVMCTYQILLIHSTWCLRVSGWDILYCTAVPEDLCSAPQNSDKNQAHVCNPRAGVWEKQAGSFILPAKAELQTHWETQSQQMKGKTIHERNQISTPGFHTYHTLTHSDMCLNTHGEEKRKKTFEMYTRAGTDYDETRPLFNNTLLGIPFP